MPDPSVSDALLEAYAVAPSDDQVIDTLEIRHPLFVDDLGAPASVFITSNDEDVIARLEAAAPLNGGNLQAFTAVPFGFSLAPVEAGATPEIEISIGNVNPALVEKLDLAVTDTNKITVVYRPYLASDLEGGPQMNPPPAFELASVTVTALAVSARARTNIDLRAAFPRRLYTAGEFPGLIGS